MEIDKECKIILDLLPNYAEGLLSNESNLYVENHIKNCPKCQNALETIKKENEKDGYFSKNETSKSINIFKKYNFKLNIFRSIFLIVLVVIIIFAITFILCQYKGQFIINEIEKKEQEPIESENYCISGETIYINHQNKEKQSLISKTYVKGSKYKIELKTNPEIYYQDYKLTTGEDSDFISLEYGTFNSQERIVAFPNTMTARKEISENSFDVIKKDSLISKNAAFFSTSFIKYFRKEKYMGKKCYVKRFANNITGYTEFWLDAETFSLVKTVEEQYGKYYKESIDTISY